MSPIRRRAVERLDLETLRSSLALVLRDAAPLRIDWDLAVELGAPDWDDPDDVFLVGLGGLQLAFDRRDVRTTAEALERIADQAHDLIVEDLPSHHLPTNWPQCPHHPTTHPLVVRRVRKSVGWACPVTRRVLAPIGELSG